MFKKFAVGLVVAALLIGGSFSSVSAQGITIEQLVDLFISLGIIAPDKAAAAKAAVSNTGSASVASDAAPSGASCEPLLTRDLTLGSSGADVKVLQNQLGLYPGSSYFGTGTLEAVRKFQASNGITATGNVGPETRAKFNSVYGCSSATNPASTVTTSSMSSVAPTFALVGSPTITQNSYDYSVGATTTVSAIFNVSITATGADFKFFKQATANASFAPSLVGIHRNGVRVGTLATQNAPGATPIASYQTPSYGVSESGDAFTLARNNTITIPVTIQFHPTGSASNYWQIALEGIRWQRVGDSAVQTSDFSGKADWKTSTVSASGPDVVVPTTPTTSIYHSADINRDWKIDSVELEKFQALYNSKVGTVRTGDYSCVYGGFVAGSGDRSCTPHSADTNKDWKISLLELTRVIEFKNSAGYKVQAGTEDGFAPIVTTTPQNPTTNTAMIVNQVPVTGSIQLTAGDSLAMAAKFEVKAGTHDVTVQRIKIDLGTSDYIYRAFKKMYITDAAGTVYSQADINANTIVREGSNHILTLGGFYYVVPKGATRVMQVKVDMQSSIPSADRGQRSISIPLNGVRAVDAAGIDTYGPASNISQNILVVDHGPTVTPVSSCTDSDGGVDIYVAGLTDGRVNGLGSYFNDSSVGSNGGACSGEGCTGVAEGYCSNGQVTNKVQQCPSGYSVNGVCATKPTTSTVTYPAVTTACYASPSVSTLGQQATGWTSTVTGGTGYYSYEWLLNDSDAVVTGGKNSSSVSVSYSVAGTKTATIKVTSGTETKLANCSMTLLAPQAPVQQQPSSGHHSADTNKDWKIDDGEFARVQTLYNYKNGTTRTGEYHCASGTVDGYDVAAGDTSCGNHSADSNGDWKISLLELTRVIEFKNSSGYKTQTGSEDGFAPISANYDASNLGSAYVSLEDIMKLVNALR